MLDTLQIATQPISFNRSNRNIASSPVSQSWNSSVAKDLYVVTEDNWHEVLLTPENIINIKKPLSPPKRRESYSSLQDFLLNNSNKPAEVSESRSNASPPPAGKSPSPEKTRWAGPAFCNSPAPKDLPKPSFHGPASLPTYVLNHRSQSLPVLPLDSLKEGAPAHSEQTQPSPTKRQSPKQTSHSRSREESYQASPTKKKATYVPKQKAPPAQETPAPAPSTAPGPAPATVQLEELSNQLKQMLNLKTA